MHCLHLFILVFFSWQISTTSAEPRVVCYVTNWSFYQPGTREFKFEYVNPHLCTHLIYAFAKLTNDTIVTSDPYIDIDRAGYANFTGLKNSNKDLKTLIGVGGWNAAADILSYLVVSPQRRKQFVENSIRFLRDHNFDGLDLDWQHPTLRGGKPEDTDNYVALVRDLRNEFQRESAKSGKPQLLLTMTVPARGITNTSDGYDIQHLIRYVDWMSILGYDYYTSESPTVQHHSPLYRIPQDTEKNLNVNYTVNFFLNQVQEEDIGKLQLGLPAYGRSYVLDEPEVTDIGSTSAGPGIRGNFTEQAGYLAYFEICEMLATDKQWKVDRPYANDMGPYAHKDDQWVGYDDPDMIRRKAEFAAQNKLGGIIFWALDTDDFLGTCTGKPYPLIESAKEAFIAASTPSYIIPSSVSIVPSPDFFDNDFECQEQGRFPHLKDCKKYYICDLGSPQSRLVAQEFVCKRGTYFNKFLKVCQGGNCSTEPEVKTTDETTTRITATPKLLLKPNEEASKTIKELRGRINELEMQLELFTHKLAVATTTLKTYEGNHVVTKVEVIKEENVMNHISKTKKEEEDKPLSMSIFQDTSTQSTEHDAKSSLLTSLNFLLNDTYALNLKLFKAKK